MKPWVRVAESEVRQLGERLPIVKGKRAGDNGVTAYVCEGGVCALPTSDVERFRRQLEEPVDEPEASKKIGSNDS